VHLAGHGDHPGDLLLDLLGLVGLVRALQDLAQPDLAALETLPCLDELTQHRGRREEMVQHLRAPLLDAPGDGHLALAGEQAHRGDLLHVGTERVVYGCPDAQLLVLGPHCLLGVARLPRLRIRPGHRE
jgi:hypothetical protein